MTMILTLLLTTDTKPSVVLGQLTRRILQV